MCVSVFVETWQECSSTPIGDSALPSWSVRLWHAFKRAVSTKGPIQSDLPCVSSPWNPRGTWLLNLAKSNESQETTSVTPSSITQGRKTPLQCSLAAYDFSSLISPQFGWQLQTLTVWDFYSEESFQGTVIDIQLNSILATQQFGKNQMSKTCIIFLG